MKSWLARLLLSALFATSLTVFVREAGAQEAGAQAATCPPAPPLSSDLKLPHLAGLLAARRPIRIVAIGGLSTAGNPANGTAGLAYPERLKEALIARLGPLSITVVNKGIPRQSSASEVARFPADVFANQPDLVIWETGTNDAVSGVDRDTFAARIQSGIDQLKEKGLEVVLMNPQFSPQSLTLVDFEPYVAALTRVADINDVLLFDRYQLMRDWIEGGYFPMQDLTPEKRAGTARAIYQCVAERLADLLVASTR